MTVRIVLKEETIYFDNVSYIGHDIWSSEVVIKFKKKISKEDIPDCLEEIISRVSDDDKYIAFIADPEYVFGVGVSDSGINMRKDF